MAERIVIEGDALLELPRLERRPDVIITSLPDLAELDLPLAEYQAWFREAAVAVLDAVPADGVAIFFQTDRRQDGVTLSKAGLLLGLERRLLFHKVALRRAPGVPDLYRPTFSHLLAFSERGRVGQATADVLQAGPARHRNGMGAGVSAAAAWWARRFGGRLCDPFCGSGAVLDAADDAGYDVAVGIDIDPACCEASRQRGIL